MTGRELFGHMLTLGGKTGWNEETEGDARYRAANLALREINILFPLTNKVRLLHYPLRPVSYHKGITVHKGGEDIEFNASGVMSLAFAVSGTGNAELYVNGVQMTNVPEDNGLMCQNGDPLLEGWNDLNDFVIFRWLGETNADVKLKFTGDCLYMIKDVTFYGDALSENIEDVMTYGPWIEYDMNSQKYANAGFMEFASVPVAIDGDNSVELREYKIEGSRIYIPTSICGIVEVPYRRHPKTLTVDDVPTDESVPCSELDLDPELHELVPFLAAYYLYYLDDPEAADTCYKEYQRRLGVVIAKIRKVRTPRKFRDVRGW